METQAFRFAYGESSLGTVLAAFSDQGLAVVLLGDSRERLYGELVRSFPQANLTQDEASLADLLARVVSAVNSPGSELNLPLHMHGSDVQLAVWQALRQIPHGETRSYGQIAKALPVAATAQEVGAACAANVLAVVVPCHRVVKADGSISGYRWGVSRKRQLIAMEQAA